jgi:anti-sigma factor RsiW
MTCEEAIEKLADYLDAELTPATLAEFEAHLRECDPCRAYLATYRKTKELTAKVNRVEMPEAFRTRLLAFLVGQIRRSP